MKYGISKDDIDYIKRRDKDCVYCGKIFDITHNPEKRVDWDTIEHLNHRADWDSVRSYIRDHKPVPEIIVICCASCNSSRGSKPLLEWFKSKYCISRKINIDTVDETVRNYVLTIESLIS